MIASVAHSWVSRFLVLYIAVCGKKYSKLQLSHGRPKGNGLENLLLHSGHSRHAPKFLAQSVRACDKKSGYDICDKGL